MQPETLLRRTRVRGDLDPAVSRWHGPVKWVPAIPCYLVGFTALGHRDS